MLTIVANQSALTLEAVHDVIGFDQPKLCATVEGSEILVRGPYLVFEHDVVSNPEGPITEFEVEIAIPALYPRHEPQVYEVGGRIPRHPHRHINLTGDCCITVWEHWLLSTRDHSFSAFLNGPMNEYFLGQYWYEEKGRWPFGERSHGQKGLIEAYADVVGIPPRKKELQYYLRLLRQDWPKGHWKCPCGSGQQLRHCHKEELMAAHDRVPPKMAMQMLRRLQSQK